MIETRASSFSYGTGQRELGYGQDVSPHLQQRSVHLPVIIGKNTQPHNFTDQTADLIFTIAFFNTHQQAVAFTDSAGAFTSGLDPSGFNPL